MNEKLSLFYDFMIGGRTYVSFSDLLINSILIVVFSLILNKTYIVCGNSLTNRSRFSNNFLLLAFTTMIIITVVKSSLALSLGLVGALSTIRFRAAINEPEELAYLFLNIALGLGLGANQQLFTSFAFLIIILFIWIRYYVNRKKINKNLFLSVKNGNLKTVKLDDITKIIKKNSVVVRIKSFVEDNQNFEVTFNLGITDYNNLIKTRNEILNLDNSITISFVDNNI